MNNIKKAATELCPSNPEESFFHYTDSDIWIEGFRFGALSDASKEYWRRGMYTNKQMNEAYLAGWKNAQRLNTYSEEEVRELLKAFKVTMELAKKMGLSCDIIELFEEHKKK
jgi:hypothetical protein